MEIKRPSPFSLRLSPEQRIQLEQDAGDTPLGAYILAKVFNGEAAPVRRGKRPVKDHQALAQALGKLGHSRLSSNLNQLAKAAHTGSLPVTPDTEAAIKEALAEIHEIRRLLLEALNLDADS